MFIKLYQINPDRDGKRVAFEWLSELHGDPDASIYDLVFTGDVDHDDLEGVFQHFNTTRPGTGRSMSVSDVVETDDGFFYCDGIGFKEIDFDADRAHRPDLRVVLVEPGKPAREAYIEHSLEGMYRALGCDLIQALHPFRDPVTLVCDDEGKFNGQRPNRALYGPSGIPYDYIAGPFFIVGESGDEFASLSDEMVYKYLHEYERPERLFAQ